MSKENTEHAAVRSLSVAAAIAAGTAAYSAPVRFENDAGFDWNNSLLDLTLPADMQPAGGLPSVTGTAVYLEFRYYYGKPGSSYRTNIVRGGARIWEEPRTLGNVEYNVAPFTFGESVGPGLGDGRWDTASRLAAFASSNYKNPYYGLLPYDGTPTYIGVQLTIDDAFHYGWIGLTNDRALIDVFAWGYETQAGVAIGAGVPAPSSMGLLAVGAVGALSRKRRAS